MRYEDASGSFQASGPNANDDSDTLSAGSRQAATGNLITGEGTQYGAAGADSAAGGHITSIAGKGGEDSSFAGGKLSVTGEHGNLSVDAEGNYNYIANKGAPENVRDRFIYTLADNQGNSDTAALVIELGKTPVVIKADAQQVVPGPDGVVTLPPGVELSDVMVVGRNLVINMPDGTQLIIVDGAIFVPQLVLDGVQVPATNVAALLIGQEPQPAAGELPPSSGGNFALPPPPLDPGVPLGDLIPPTVRDYVPPEPQEVFPEEDSEPEVGPNPDVLLDDDALQGGNAGGVGDDPDAVNVSGQLSGSGGDDELAFTVQLTGAPAGFTYESGGDGVVLIKQGGVTVLTVTVDSDGSYSVVQNAPIDHTGANEDNVLFTINYTVTDVDGDSAFGTFNINVDDDTPLLTELVARGGVTLDETTAGSPAGFPISGNSALPIIDFNALFGADGAAAVNSTVFGLTLNGGNSGIQTAVGDFPITLVQIDSDTIEGHYNGSNVAFIIQLEADGTVTLTQNVPLEHDVDGPPGPAHDDTLDLGGLIAVTVTVADGDGDEVSAEVGIGDLLVFKDDGPTLGEGEVTASVDEDELPDGITDGDGEDTTATGTLSGIAADFGADGPGSFGWDSSALGGLPSLSSNGAAISYAIVGNMLVAYTGADASNAASHVFTVELQANGDYEVTLLAQVDHLPNSPANDDDQALTIDLSGLVKVTDADGDFDHLNEGQFVVEIEDDIPEPLREVNPVTGQVDEDLLADGNNDSAAGDDPGGTTASGGAGSLLTLFNIGADQPGVIVLLTDTSGLPALTSNGVPVTYAVVGDTLTASAGATDVFTLTVNEDGSWDFELLDQLDHPEADTEDNLLLDFSSIISAEDADGDTAAPLPNGSFVIDVDDDLPAPVTEPNPVTGQVDEDLLADGNNDSAAGDDPGGTTASGGAGSLLTLFNIGADQPGVIVLLTDTSGLPALTSNGVPVTYAVVGDTLTASAGATDVFTLTVNEDGSWDFELLDQLDHPEADTEDNLLLDFSSIISAEDADGDTAAPLPNGSFVIDVDDDLPAPVTEPNPVTGQVDEDLLADGNNDSAAGDDPGGTTASGGAGSLLTLFNIGADQPGVIVLLTDTSGLPALTSNGVPVTYAVVGDTLTASAGATDVFTLTVNEDGSWDFELLDQLDHPEADTEDNLLLDFSSIISAEDADGDTAAPLPNGSFVIDVDDDSPTIVGSGEEPSLVVDETILAANATQNFAGAFTPSFGSDGPGATPVSYALGIVAGASGLVDTLTGEAVILSMNGSVVEGRTAVGGDLVFTISVDSLGNVTLDQSRAVVHDDPNDSDEAASPAQLASDDLVTLTATITDGDGDQASTTILIGQNLNFEDDGPNIVANQSALPSLTVDETNFAVDASANFAGNFTSLFGNDGFKDVDDNDIPDADAIAYALGIIAPDADSGLVDTLSGEAVVLSMNGSVVEGRTAVGGDLVFTVSVNSATGVVTLNQLRAVVHNDPNDPDEALSPAQLSAANLITLTATVTDGDLDQDSATIDIGLSLNFEDDGPSALNDADSIIGGAGPATGNVITGIDIGGGDANTTDGVADSAGADTPGTITRIASNNVLANIDTTYDGLNNLVVAGQYGTLTINQDGSYSYTRTDLGAAGVSDVFTYTFTDGDGDTVTATLTIGIQDNFPNAGNVNVQVDDDAVLGAGGNTGGPNDDADATNVSGNLPGSGGDAPLTWGILLTGAPLGFTYEAGAANQVLVKQGGVTVLTVTITNTATGAYTVVQNAPIVHDSQDGTGTDNTENNVQFTINYTVTDADGDPANGTININVDDDTPTVTNLGAQPTLVVDETVLTTDNTQSFAGAFTVSYGADGAAAVNALVYTLGVVVGPSGLVDTATGQNVILSMNAGVVEGRTAVSGDLVFTVSVAANGDVTLNQLRAVVHNDPNDPDEPGGSAATLSADNLITLTAAATDKDGDTTTASINIGQNLQFEDDGPAITATGPQPTLIVDETVLATDATQSFAGAFSPTFGADGPAATPVTYALGVVAGASGLVDTATGQNVVLSMNGSVVEGRTAISGDLVFTVSVAANGDVTLNQLRAVVHNDPADPDEPGLSAAMLSADNLITLTATATDKDGDHVSATIDIGQNLQFEDDGPAITSAEDINIENAGDIAHTGAFVLNLGADGAPLNNNVFTAVTGGATVNGVAVTNWLISETSENASTAVYSFSFDYPVGGGLTAHETGTLTFDKVAGTYTVDLANPIAGVSVESVQNGELPTFYDVDRNGDGDNTDNNENDLVAVVEIASDLFIQFTGQSNVTTPASAFGNEDLWGGGTQSAVHISSTAIGVFGNSVQAPDVLDYNFYATDPGANVGAPTASAGVAYIKVSQFNGAEDFVVTLKLADPNNFGVVIERTFVINADDVLTTAPPGFPALTNGTGFIIFEPNDYRSLANVPDTYEIVGMQLRSSTEGVQSTVGEVYNFDGDLGQADVSAATFGPPGGGDQGTNDNDVFKIEDIGVVRVTTTDQEAELTFNVTIQDGDGDTDSLTLTATVTANPDSETPIIIPPMALDTNGDGSITFVDHSAGVAYDYDGDGVAEATAWVGGGDSILVRDANGDGTVTDASEFVFGGNGITDMQALAAQYGDTLDANDADFGQFKVWTDGNMNAVADAGELQSLSDAGITSIGLVSDGQAYSAANGDVAVAGTASYTKADGSTGAVADASFLTGRLADDARAISTSSSSLAIAAAVAAAGLADKTAAHSDNGNDGHGQNSDMASFAALETVERYSVSDDGGNAAVSMLAPEASTEASDLADTSSSSSSDNSPASNSLDDSAAQAAPESNDAPAADDGGANSSADAAGLVAPTVAMVSAEALEAAANDNGNAQQGGSVEQIVADALHQGDASDLDAVLANLLGGNGGLQAIAHMASPDVAAVSGWHTGGHGAIGAGFDMMFKMDVSMHHQDAAQPVQNG